MIPSTTLKIAVVAPMASAMVSTAMLLNPAFLRIWRPANAMSRLTSSIMSDCFMALCLLLLISSTSSRTLSTSPNRHSAAARASSGDIPERSYFAALSSR